MKNQTTADVQHYYETSDDELARRYIKDERFLSLEYCKAALDHQTADRAAATTTFGLKRGL